MRDQGLQFSSESHLSHSQGDKDPKLISQLDSFWLIMGTRNPPALAWGYQFKDRIMRTAMIDSQSKSIFDTRYLSPPILLTWKQAGAICPESEQLRVW